MNATQFESKFTKLSHFLENIVICGKVSDIYEVSTYQQKEIELLLMHDVDSEELQEVVEQYSDIITGMIKGDIRENQTVEEYIKEQLFEDHFEEIRDYINHIVDTFSLSAENDFYSDFSLRDVVEVAC